LLAQTAAELTATKAPVDAALSALDALSAKTEASDFRPRLSISAPRNLAFIALRWRQHSLMPFRRLAA
jgi:hypothetical protein